MDERQRAMHSSASFRAALPAIPRETTPRTISHAVQRLCNRLAPDRGPVFVEVQSPSFEEVGECYKNVQAQVENEGGRTQTGWVIWEMPRVLLNAERHCCWLSPDGRLMDVTPKADGESQILFVPDCTPWKGERVCPQIEPLSQEPVVQHYIDAVLAERQQWEKRIVDLRLKQKAFEAAQRLNAFLATPRHRGKRRVRK